MAEDRRFIPISELFPEEEPVQPVTPQPTAEKPTPLEQLFEPGKLPERVPLDKLEALINTLNPPEKEKTAIDKYIEYQKWSFGMAENALGQALSGLIVEPAVGIFGGAKLMTDPRAAKKETIDPLREALTSVLPPYTKKGKELAVTIGEGAEAVTEPFLSRYKKWVTEPAGKKATEKLGINIGSAVEAGLETLPAAIDALAGTKRGQRVKRKLTGRIPYKQYRRRRWYTELTPTVTDRGAYKKASSFMVNNFRRTPIGVKNATEAARLERMFPGLKFDITGVYEDPVSMRAVKGMKERYPRAAEKLWNRLEERNVKAVRRKLRSIKPIDDVDRIRESLEVKLGALESFRESEELLRKTKVSKMRGFKGTDWSPKAFEEAGAEAYTKAGAEIRRTINEAENATRRASGMLFEKVPDDLIDMNYAVKKLHEILEPTSKAEKRGDNVPKEIMTLIRNLNHDSNVITAKELQAARSDILRSVRSMERSNAERNRNAERRMYRAIGALDDAMRSAEMGSPEAARLFEEARRFHFNEVVAKYETRDIQRLRKEPHQDRFVQDSEAAGLFFKKGKEGIAPAIQFVEAVGGRKKKGRNEGVYQAMEAWIDNDLIDSVYDAKTNSIKTADLSKWLNEHKYALGELGMRDRYDSISKIQDRIDDAIILKDNFDKSVAGKILDADVGKEVEFLRNSKTPGKDAMELMSIIGKDDRAVRGVQRALIEQIEMHHPSSVKELDDLYKKNKQVYGAVFARDREKLKVMIDYRRALKKLYPKGELPTDIGDIDKVFREFSRDKPGFITVIGALKELFIRTIPEAGKDRVRELILKAALDPDMANELRQLGKKRLPPKLAEARLRKYVYSIAPTVAARKLFIDDEEEE